MREPGTRLTLCNSHCTTIGGLDSGGSGRRRARHGRSRSDAAVIAHDGGARVAVFEKADQVGGTTAWSGGMVWIPNNPHMADVGVEDSREQALGYMHVAVPRHCRATARRGVRRRRPGDGRATSRRGRRSTSTPSPGCPTTTPSSPAAARAAGARSNARSTRSTSSASGPSGSRRRPTSPIRHITMNETPLGKAVPEPPSAEEHAAPQRHNERGAARRSAGRLLRPASTAASNRGTGVPRRSS